MAAVVEGEDVEVVAAGTVVDDMVSI